MSGQYHPAIDVNSMPLYRGRKVGEITGQSSLPSGERGREKEREGGGRAGEREKEREGGGRERERGRERGGERAREREGRGRDRERE